MSTTLTKKQKLNILNSTRESYKSRLESMVTETPLSERIQQNFLDRKAKLETCLRFCEYLQVALQQDRDFECENIKMLEYIGLPELYECETKEIL